MKIERRKNGSINTVQIREELGDILRSDASAKPVCSPGCPHASPERCSRHCPDVPWTLSTDPKNHPLEPGIAPLVYELKRLKVF